MKNKATVAVITRTKDRIVLLKRAIESVSNQTFKDWIISLVNDGGNKEELNTYLKTLPYEIREKIVVNHNPQSLGMEAASNVGIKSTDSKYVIIHDDDDSWDEKFLEKTVSFLENNQFEDCKGVVTHSIRVIEAIENDNVKIIKKEPYNTWMNHISLFRMAAENTFPPISFLFKREVFNDIGYFDETLPVLGDWEFNLRFLEKYEIFILHETLANYHHRVNLVNSNYSNSVFGASGKHQFYDNLLRNRMIREDMKNNRIGLGFLINIGKSFETVHRQISPIEQVLNKFKSNRLVRKIFLR